jgi:hypothetical protein
VPGAPRADGTSRRLLWRSAFRQIRVAIRYSQFFTDERPSNRSKPLHARRYVS